MFFAQQAVYFARSIAKSKKMALLVYSYQIEKHK
tara:strand:- start:12292 stop:12393 length:102 start_codon:yes stop_codon:yes gene_type:complete